MIEKKIENKIGLSLGFTYFLDEIAFIRYVTNFEIKVDIFFFFRVLFLLFTLAVRNLNFKNKVCVHKLRVG